MANELFGFMLGSIPAIALVYLAVEGLKRFGFVSEKRMVTAPRAALLVALVLIILGLVGAFVSGAQAYIDIAAPIVFGGLVAGLFYDLAGDLLLQRVKAAIAALLGE